MFVILNVFQPCYPLTTDMSKLIFCLGMSIKWSGYRNNCNTVLSLVYYEYDFMQIFFPLLTGNEVHKNKEISAKT